MAECINSITKDNSKKKKKGWDTKTYHPARKFMPIENAFHITSAQISIFTLPVLFIVALTVLRFTLAFRYNCRSLSKPSSFHTSPGKVRVKKLYHAETSVHRREVGTHAHASANCGF